MCAVNVQVKLPHSVRPEVHVVVVHHRGQAILRDCVESVLACSGVDVQVIIVANGCDEDLPHDVVEQPRVHVVSLRAGVGFSEANNLGVEWARTRLGVPGFYYFLNNDTESDEASLATLVRALETNPGAAVVGPLLRIAWARDYLNSLGLNVTEDGWGWDEGIGQRIDRYGDLPSQRTVLAVTGSALLITAEAFERVKGWTELYGYYFEDIDLCLKVWEAGLEVLHEPGAVVYHHVSATMALGSEQKEFYFWRNRLVLILLHWPPPRLLNVIVRILREQLFRSSVNATRRLRLSSFLSAARCLPRVVGARVMRHASQKTWCRFLRPTGSIPPIRFPDELELWAAPRTGGHKGRRVLVLGAAPLLMEQANRNFAAGARTWQLVLPMIDAGYEVLLVGCRLPHSYPDDTPVVSRVEDQPGFRYVSVAPEVFGAPGFLRGLAESFDPGSLVFAHASVSFDPELSSLALPTWIDINGHIMTEAQAKAAAYRNDLFLDHFFRINVEILRAGDRFSSCCEPQTWAMVGELGLIGRLNSHNNGEALVATIPVGVADQDYEPWRPAYRGIDVPEDAFVVLWSGGYNTWTDIDTMFRGLEGAMELEPSLYFVSTGGQIDGHDEVTYPDFVARIGASPLKDRFILKGWIPREEVPDHYLEADVGLNCEKAIYEVVFGSKQRILDWSRASLPPVTSRLTELSRVIESENVGWVYEPGDWRRLAEILVMLARDRVQVRETGRRFRKKMVEIFGYAATAAPLLEWLRNPQAASDRSRSTHCIEGMMWRQSILAREVLRYEARHGVNPSESLIGADGLARLDAERNV